MDWETKTPSFSDLSDADIPVELLDGLERLSRGSKLIKIRVRWRPHQTAATGFLTKNRLLGVEGDSNLEIARAVASYATHLHEGGSCENKFEAQVRRELEEPLEDGTKREWRSITFYLNSGMLDDMTASPDDEPVTWETSPSAAPAPPSGYRDYAGFVDLSRSDPTAFAMLVTQQSCDRMVSTLERLLLSTVGRLDGFLARQGSNSRHLNEALQTLTKGAGDIAGVGVELFQRGLEGQAQVAQMQHETEIGKERTELMRDTVKQGSLLIQAVLMANTAKRGRGASADTSPSAGADSPRTPPAAANDDGGSEADRDIVARARRLLALVTDEIRDELREVAPSLVAVFDELDERPLTAAVVREVVVGAQESVDRAELNRAGELFDPEISNAFAGLLMRVFSEGM